MKIPNHIAEKVKEYQKAKEIADRAYEEVTSWLNENTDADGIYIGELQIVDKPIGRKQNDDEYCNQSCHGYSEDAFYGTYYHPIEGSTQYLEYGYEC